MLSPSAAFRRLPGCVRYSADSYYRPDIDGLRAVAVLAVVAFHYFPGRLPGGFVGVDVFFVISGYLITGIIAREFEQQRFSIWTFYQRRIRRIFPALTLILAFCLIVGWFVLFPSEYETLGKYVAAGAGFVENFALWAEVGYFDGNAIEKPLLHLWSLAIEEQYYLLWPLTLWFMMRRRWPQMATIAAIAVVSFAINIWYVHGGDTAAAFYSPASRAWELMAGSWLAIAHRHKTPWVQHLPELQSWLGLAMILVGIFVIRKEHFPGFWALLPIVGTALAINGGPLRLPNRTVLSWQPVVWVGLISYPLYLWHWVLWSMVNVVFGQEAFEANESRAIRIGLALLSVLLAWLTYRYFEQPVRKAGKTKSTLMLAAVVATLGAMGVAVMAAKGVPARPGTLNSPASVKLVESVVKPDIPANCFDRLAGGTFDDDWVCHLGNRNAKVKILAYGDSHAEFNFPAFQYLARQADIDVMFASERGCLAASGTYTPEEEPAERTICNEFAQNVAAFAIQQHVNLAIVFQRWTRYGILGKTQPGDGVKMFIQDQAGHRTAAPGLRVIEHGLTQDLSRYAQAGIPVLLMKDNPQQPQKYDEPATAMMRFDVSRVPLLQKSATTYQQHVNDQAGVNALLDKLAARFSNVTTLNTDSALCTRTSCPWISNGKFLYYNNDHLSKAGSMRIYPLLVERINKILGLNIPVPELPPLQSNIR
ncbi:MAG: acyltransferase [Nevskiaceae bacterium]|nr:MAG: acyltransferase [Nevskiaceae bacterium]TBR71397.1 MAG: acyltransferase [Nevskiaceae bacterium]